MSTVVKTSESFKSRWGYHPCSYETFKRLKVLHKVFWQHVRKIAAAKRWKAKQSQNREGSEPKFCAVFDVRENTWVEGKGYQKVWDLHEIRLLYQRARRPSKDPVDVFEGAVLDKFDHWESALIDWNLSNGVNVSFVISDHKSKWSML